MKIVNDSASGLEMGVDDQGNEYRTGLLPGLPLAGAPVFADSFPTMDEKDWRDVDLWVHDPQTYDQGRTNSCGGHGSVAACSGAYHLGGPDKKRFAPFYTYGNIISDGRGDSGARLDELLRDISQRGMALESSVKPGQLNRRLWPDVARIDAEAALARGVEWFHVRNAEEAATAHQLGFFVAFGCWFGSALGTPTGKVAPPWRSRTGGHCIASGGVKKLSTGQWVWAIKNSHAGSTLIYLPREYLSQDNIATFGGAWAIRATTNDPAAEPKFS